MAQWKVTIINKAVEEVASVVSFIEGKGLPATAKKFVDSAFLFFEKLRKSPVTRKVESRCEMECCKRKVYR